MTSAAATVFVLLHGTASAADVVTLATKITGVAGGTERLVLIERPYKGAVDVTTMAAATAWIHPVVARVVATGAVAEDVRRPGIG